MPDTGPDTVTASDGSFDSRRLQQLPLLAAGVTVMKAKVKVIGDNTVEGNETLSVSLSSPGGATIADGIAVGTIVTTD